MALILGKTMPASLLSGAEVRNQHLRHEKSLPRLEIMREIHGPVHPDLPGSPHQSVDPPVRLRKRFLCKCVAFADSSGIAVHHLLHICLKLLRGISGCWLPVGIVRLDFLHGTADPGVCECIPRRMYHRVDAVPAFCHTAFCYSAFSYSPFSNTAFCSSVFSYTVFGKVKILSCRRSLVFTGLHLRPQRLQIPEYGQRCQFSFRESTGHIFLRTAARHISGSVESRNRCPSSVVDPKATRGMPSDNIGFCPLDLHVLFIRSLTSRHPLQCL